jgi:hypothetical protein
MGDNPAPGYVVSGCGCMLVLLSMAVTAFGAFHVFLDQGGKISGDEALPALGGGVCCGVSSLLIVGLGVFLVLQAKKAAAAVAAAETAGGAPPAAPGAPPPTDAT